MNGKEGLDIGDLKVTRRYSNYLKNQYIEHLDLKKCFDSKSIKLLSNYFDEIFSLSELLFKGIIKLYNKNPDLSKLAFSRLKTLSTLRFNYYPKQNKPVEISNQDRLLTEFCGKRKKDYQFHFFLSHLLTLK